MTQNKPCPFCGMPSTKAVKINETGRPVWKIECTAFCITMYRHSKKEVEADWNKRYSEKEQK